MVLDLVKIVGAIGKSAIWHVNGMEVPVKIINAKIAYGHAYYLIKTGAGNATRWVMDDNIETSLPMEVARGAWNFIKETLLS